jgi:hypothetical protein
MVEWRQIESGNQQRMRFDCKNSEAKKKKSPRFKDNRLSPQESQRAALQVHVERRKRA